MIDTTFIYMYMFYIAMAVFVYTGSYDIHSMMMNF